MADKKISQLTPATTPLAGTETLPIVQAGQTVKATVQDVLGYVVNDSTNSVLKTVYSASDVGLKLDFANAIYSIGWNNFSKGLIINQSSSTIYLGDDAVSGTGAGIKIENDTDIYIGDYTQGFADGLTFSVTSSNNTIKTAFQGSDNGLKLDFANNLYQFGDVNVNGNYIQVDSAGSIIQIVTQGSRVMFEATQTYTTIGDVTGVSNSTTFGVDDAGQTLTASGNLLSGNAGASSGQHLKINVGGTDYVIELLET